MGKSTEPLKTRQYVTAETLTGGGLLHTGRATRITLAISALGIFRVVKTTTLISVKQLIHSNLQVAPQLRRHWLKTRQYVTTETLKDY